MRIIAMVDNDSLGLVAESEVLGATDATKSVLVEVGYARIYDDTKPMVGKSVNPYESKSYPAGRQVFYNDSIYVSNVTTSTTWVLSEWTCLVHGTQAV